MAQVADPRHPLAVLSLKPLSDRAWDVVRDPNNGHLVSGSDSRMHLDIGGIPSAANDGVTLATLGRRGDVHIEGESVARVQCAFEMHPDSRVVMLYDRSHNNSTQVHTVGSDGRLEPAKYPFEHGRPRKVCVDPSFNVILGMCGAGRDLILFQLIWPGDAGNVLTRRAQRYDVASLARVPHLAKTLDDTEAAPETTRATRMHTPDLGDAMKIRYHKWEVLGEGAFGVVHRVLNVDTGRVMALKMLKRSTTTTANWEKCQREVHILSQIQHPHILELLWSQRWDHPEAEIFLRLNDGALNTLVLDKQYLAHMTLDELTSRVCEHMLRALDALDCRGLIHRDLKPENIFYVLRNGIYKFQLGDFGLSNHSSIALSTHVGSEIFMAPEMYSGSRPRTPKVDVWSLFVTLLWTLDFGGFRSDCENYASYNQICTTVQALAARDGMARMRPMAAFHPDQRASAAQMLCACFGGRGLTTPRDQVPPLPAPSSFHPSEHQSQAGPSSADAVPKQGRGKEVAPQTEQGLQHNQHRAHEAAAARDGTLDVAMGSTSSDVQMHSGSDKNSPSLANLPSERNWAAH